MKRTKSIKVAFTVDWELWRNKEGIYELHDLMANESITIDPFDDLDQIIILTKRMEKDFDEYMELYQDE